MILGCLKLVNRITLLDYKSSYSSFMKRLVLLFALTSPLIAFADEHNWLERIQVHGFASQGLIFTTDNNFYGDSEHGSAAMTELGLNASIQLSPKIRLAGQVISRNAGEMDNGSPHLDYALLDINLITSTKGRLGAYLGRIKNPLGLYNDTRDVAHTRQGIFTAQTIYFDKVRDLIMSADGAQLYGEYFLPNGTLLVQGGVGYPIPDDNVEQVYLGQDHQGKLDGNELAIVGRIMYEHDGGRWILAASGATLDIDFEGTAADALGPFIPGIGYIPQLLGINSGTIGIDYTIFSAQYNSEKWQLTGELAYEDINFIDIGGLFSDADVKSYGYSLEANYKFTSKWETFIRREAFYLDKEDKYGKNFEAASKQLNNTYPFIPATPGHVRYSENWIMGMRWLISPNWMARAEYQVNKGATILSQAENDIANTTKDWDLFAISLSYRF